MDVYSPNIDLPNSSSDLLTPVVQDAIIAEDNAAATWQHSQDVIDRLVRCCAFYDAEIAQQEERIADITRALANLDAQNNNTAFMQVAQVTLNASLSDAQSCLSEAKLAKQRFEMELGTWPAATSKN
ncbi:hypothetical protein IWW38_002543 [Coemansia aciculifera]|uniref:Uncharacterized protein n=1 Tax=Coemansia aciculifera TaxID=417176 RepID=A0ACC1M3R9_9FUNG|nr:hypothetical protein IWW38_002543 [Coemansia aciculifera]